MPYTKTTYDSTNITPANLNHGETQYDSAMADAVAKNALVYNVKDFGAVGDGTTDDSAAIGAALASVPYGGVIYFPSGGYVWTTNATIPAGVTLQGSGRYNCGILLNNTTGGLTLGSQNVIRDISVRSTVTHTDGAFLTISANGVTLQNINFSGYLGCIHLPTGSSPVTSLRILSCDFGTTNVSNPSYAIYAESYSNLVIDTCVILGTTSGLQPNFGIRLQSGDTCVISNTNVTRHGVALQVDPVAGQPHNYALQVSNSLFDSTGSTNANSNPSTVQIGGSGQVYGVKFANTWFGYSLNGSSGCYIGNGASGSQVDGVSFSGCEFVNNGDNGLNCVGQGGTVANINVSGGWSARNTNNGLRFYNVSGFTVTGHHAGNNSGRGNNGAYGILVDAQPSNNYLIVGNNLTGNSRGKISDGGTGTNKLVANNL